MNQAFDATTSVVDGSAITIADVTALVRSCGNESLRWFRGGLGSAGDGGLADERSLVVENKAAAGFDPVTDADRHVEHLIRSQLRAWFPEHVILGEEAGETGSAHASRHRWVIDPIDGTRAFVSGQPMWGTLLGLQFDEVPVAGWLHVPPLDETYVASGGVGVVHALGRERALVTSAATSLAEATLLCTHPTMFATAGEQAAFARVSDQCRLTRYSGDCVNYGLIATGDADLVVENQLQPYDVIPLIPIVEAAGGVITDRAGGPATNGGWAVAAATPELHAAALEALGG